jgi:hypothetical protein
MVCTMDGHDDAIDDQAAPGARLQTFHADVDRKAEALGKRHADRLQCGRGCSQCCVDGLSVFAVEAARIRAAHGALLSDAVPHAAGGCAFLDEAGACRIYADRPYVCRTQGLPLRVFEAGDAGGVVERRDICPLNEAGPPIEGLADVDCWLIGPHEATLRDIAKAFDPDLGRVPLRALFGVHGQSDDYVDDPAR